MRAGVDVVDIARVAALAARRPAFVERVFTPREVADSLRGGAAPGSRVASTRLAARYAAKEAARKALRDLRLGWREVEVETGPDGAPRLLVRGEPADLTLSLAHDAGVAVAFVVGPDPEG